MVEKNIAALILALSEDGTPLVVSYEDDREKVECTPASGAEASCRALQVYEGKPVIAQAIAAAEAAGASTIAILTRPALARDIETCVDSLDVTRPIEVRSLSVKDELEITRAAANFELFGITKAVLDVADEVAKTAGAELVYLLNAEQVRIDESHLAALQADIDEHKTDMALTWCRITRTTPMLIRASWLSGLGASDLCSPTNNGSDRGVATMRAFEHDNGWDQLLPNPGKTSDPTKEFFADLNLCALEAVRIAKLDEETVKSKLEKASDSDRELVAIAREVIATMAPDDKGEAAALALADAFGKRNKADFPLFNIPEYKGKLVYLDSAATTQRAGAVLDAQRDYDTHSNCNIRRSIYGLMKRSNDAWNGARSSVLHYINSDEPKGMMDRKSPQLAITMNATGALNLVAQGWGDKNVGEGDTLICWASEHHSNMLPWQTLTERKGARLIVLPLDSHGRIDMEAYVQALETKPKLVACAQVGNTIGIEYPIAKLAAMAHEAGARFVVDAAQSLAHGKVDVKALGVDFVAMSAHKMYGPQGIGGLWIAPEAFAEMECVNVGGGMVMHVTPYDFESHPGGSKFEAGSQPISPAVGWAAAIDYVKTLGVENIKSAEAALTRHAMRGFAHIDDAIVFGDHSAADGQNGLISFSLRGLPPTPIVRLLDNVGVAVRGGSHCALPLCNALGVSGTTRISLGVYNTAEDIEAALTGVALCAKLYAAR